LRALAAVAVALYHFHGYMGPLRKALPAAVNRTAEFGYLGVNVFFVLSGFVIAHSLRDARYSLRFIGRFTLRRQLRLDPPYWVTLALAAASLARDPHVAPGRLGFGTLVSHVGYLQNILGYPNLLDVFWTLCIEVQLYLAFVILAWLAQERTRISDGSRREWLFALTTLGSIALAFGGLAGKLGAWFVTYWYMFALGAWTRWALDGRRARRWLLVFLALALARSFHFGGPGPAVCVVTACLLYLGARRPRLVRPLAAAPLVYLGRISYSFYLVHALAGGAVLYAALHERTSSVARDAIALALALVASTLAAQVLWWAIERPAMTFSRRVQLRN
jgi:peptidoglycan/LPS O-acetylase OafA/YrhL